MKKQQTLCVFKTDISGCLKNEQGLVLTVELKRLRRRGKSEGKKEREREREREREEEDKIHCAADIQFFLSSLTKPSSFIDSLVTL
jgi:hypothetical protein